MNSAILAGPVQALYQGPGAKDGLIMAFEGGRPVVRIWGGQALASLGSSFTTLGLALHVFGTSQSVGWMTLLFFAGVAPVIWLAPLAGLVIDRLGVKTVLIGANLIGGLVSLGLALAFAGREAGIGLALAAAAANGAVESFRELALQTAVPLFTRTDRLQRVNGWIATVQALPMLAGPPLAAILLSVMSFPTLVAIDGLGVLLAAINLVPIAFPVPGADGGGAGDRAAVQPARIDRRGVTEGLRWIAARPPLLWLTLFGAVASLCSGAAGTLVAPYVLLRTHNDGHALATVSALLALGAMMGGLASGQLGRHLAPLPTIAVAAAANALIGRMNFGLLATGPLGWGACQFTRLAGLTLAASAEETIWQRLVPPGWRGRVMGTRRLMAQGIYPLAVLGGGLIGSVLAEGRPDRLVWCFVGFGLLEGAAVLLLWPVRRAGAVVLMPSARAAASDDPVALGLR